jgi:hypothetical protein
MDRTSLAARASRLAVAGAVAGLLSLTGAAGALGAPRKPHPILTVACKKGTHRVGDHCVKNAVKKLVPVPAIAAVPAPAPAPLAPPPPPPPPVCTDSGLYNLLSPFLVHLSAAHLEESPLQQVHDLLNTNQYVLIHTAMVDNMLAGLQPVLQSLLNLDLNGALTRLLTRTCTSS